MGWFQRKKAERTAETVINSNTYEVPSHAQNPPPYVPNGGAGWAPVALPTVEQQWATNNHYYKTQDPTEESFWPQENTLYSDEGPDSVTVVHYRAADPRWVPPNPDRRIPTPHNYSFLRPFQQQGARNLNGNHFSMASNIRAHPIGGMQPAKERNRRNTYRVEPAPWDENLVDVPSRGSNDVIQAVYQNPIASPLSRSHRFGG